MDFNCSTYIPHSPFAPEALLSDLSFLHIFFLLLPPSLCAAAEHSDNSRFTRAFPSLTYLRRSSRLGWESWVACTWGGELKSRSSFCWIWGRCLLFRVSDFSEFSLFFCFWELELKKLCFIGYLDCSSFLWFGLWVFLLVLSGWSRVWRLGCCCWFRQRRLSWLPYASTVLRLWTRVLGVGQRLWSLWCVLLSSWRF